MIETFAICAIVLAVYTLGYLAGNAKASRRRTPEIDDEEARRIIDISRGKSW